MKRINLMQEQLDAREANSKKHREYEIERMRKDSNHIKSESKLVSFLYLLLRDHLSSGVVESIVQSSTFDEETSFTNGWIADYAKDISKRLK